MEKWLCQVMVHGVTMIPWGRGTSERLPLLFPLTAFYRFQDVSGWHVLWNQVISYCICCRNRPRYYIYLDDLASWIFSCCLWELPFYSQNTLGTLQQLRRLKPPVGLCLFSCFLHPRRLTLVRWLGKGRRKWEIGADRFYLRWTCCTWKWQWCNFQNCGFFFPTQKLQNFSTSCEELWDCGNDARKQEMYVYIYICTYVTCVITNL